MSDSPVESQASTPGRRSSDPGADPGRLARSSAIVGAAGLASRVLGLGREPAGSSTRS